MICVGNRHPSELVRGMGGVGWVGGWGERCIASRKVGHGGEELPYHVGHLSGALGARERAPAVAPPARELPVVPERQRAEGDH